MSAMTSEAHKRNPPGSERWGKVNKLRPVDKELLEKFTALDDNGLEEIDVPMVYGSLVDARQLELYNAGRLDSQAAGAQGE